MARYSALEGVSESFEAKLTTAASSQKYPLSDPMKQLGITLANKYSIDAATWAAAASGCAYANGKDADGNRIIKIYAPSGFKRDYIKEKFSDCLHRHFGVNINFEVS